MINLVINEFKKTFAKKSTYVIVLILILMMVGIGSIKKYAIYQMQEYSNKEYNYDDIDSIKERLKEIEDSDFTGKANSEEEWMYTKSMIENYRLYNEFNKSEENKWKAGIAYKKPEFKSFTEKTLLELKALRSGDKSILKSDEYIKVSNAYDKDIEEYMKMTQDEFTQSKIVESEAVIKRAEKDIKELEKIEKDNPKINNGARIKDLEQEISMAKHMKDLNEIRLEKKIPYDTSNYMNSALMTYDTQKSFVLTLDKPKDDALIRDKRDYQSAVKVLEEAKYVLDTEQDINNQVSGINNLKTFFNDYLDIYLIMIIVIAGLIVSEEYSKGTIKNLLVKPYRRSTILTSKLIVVIALAVIFFLIMLIVQILISGILFDFTSMKLPVVEYSIVKEGIVKTNLFVYILENFIYTLPYVLVILFFTFAVSTITTSSAAAIILGVMSTGGTSIVNQIFGFLEVLWVKYFPTLSWNWAQYISGSYDSSYGASFTYAIIITIVTWFVLLIPAYIVFKKKDIKNI